MTPITHLLASWSVADALRLKGRDQVLLTWCGVLPDADGLGLLIDGGNRLLGRSDIWHYYSVYHHSPLHGLFAAVAIPLAMCLFAANRVRVFTVGFLAVHLHFLCDIVGSRGPSANDLWPLPYFAPFSQEWTIRWAGQWRLDGWFNVVFTLVLMGFALYRAIHSGYSPVSVFSTELDRVFAKKIRDYWSVIVPRCRASQRGRLRCRPSSRHDPFRSGDRGRR